ncbi:hypothetical protein N7454_005224 [Penicillium verhagenii]|nr:hypothetical protein N7454_005224 [Penicillium verhagenii]
MSSTSFGGTNATNTGVQLVHNYGTITNISSGVCTYRSEDPVQKIDNDVLESLAFPQMLDRRDNIEACHTNTCEWILELEEYQSWRDQPCGLLWIKGKPGAGKSTLMLFLHGILQEFHDGSHGVIRLDFFFTARGVEMQRTPLGMLRSLLNQLFSMTRPYALRCASSMKNDVLEELLASAILASAQHIIIFVDALDEAGAESAQQLAAYFHRLIDRAGRNHAGREKPALQVCISCRHYPIVETAQTVAIHVEDHNQDDITSYIEDELLETESRDDSSQEIREVLVKELAQHTKGIFQWVRLIIPFVKRRITEGESLSDIRGWLAEVPADLENVYAYILSNVITASNREQSFLFFQWIFLAERPLTLVEIRYALAAANVQISFPSRTIWEKLHGFIDSDERMKRRVNALAGGLAEVISGNDGETIQVVHQSVNDFLRDKGLLLLYHNINGRAGSIDINNILLQSQATLYRTCLAYLTTIFSNKQMSHFEERSRDDLMYEYPFVSYTAINIFIHAEKAASSRGTLLHNEIDILQQIISPWAQVYQHLYNSIEYTPYTCTGTTVLHIAASANLVDMIIPVLSSGAYIEERNKNGDTALHFAARAGNITAGKILQEKGANREAKKYDGATPLTEAAGCGCLGFVEWLLNEGVEIETGEMAALQEASLGGRSTVVEILLGAGANPNAQGGRYGNALQAAAYSGSAETVKILLDAHADVNAQGGCYGNALQAAASGGRAETVKILLDAHADVNAQGGQFGNALQAAAQSWNGGAETVKILLDAHADVNAQGGYLGNALQAAAQSWSGGAEVVKILLDAYADVNTQGGYYGNALQAAAQSWNGGAETVKILLDAHAVVNAQGGYYGNALQAAALNGSAETVKILLDAHADVNAQGGCYGNALQAAAASRNGGAKVVKILLDAYADVNAQGGQHGTTLLAAIYQGDLDTIEILLHMGADISLTDELDRTPLHIAASRDKVHVLLRFPQLASAIAINKRNRLLQTPLYLAIYFGHIDFAIKLLHLGADPSASDGYGRNAMDWALGHETLTREIHERCPQLSLTPHENQQSIVRQSLFQMANNLPELGMNQSTWLVLQQLARYFLFLDNTNNARHLFNIRLPLENPFDPSIGQAICNFCGGFTTGHRFVCRICANMDICPSCVPKHPFHDRSYPDQKHDVFEVSDQPDDKSQLTGPVPQKLKDFLDRLLCDSPVENIDESEMRQSTDSPSSMIVWGKNVLTSNTTLGLVFMFSAVFFGLLATCLKSRYF